MARFVIRNYGPSRQVAYEGQQICLSNDQCIETDDTEMAAVLGEENSIHVTDRGAEAASFVLPEEPVEKEKKVTVDDVEALHAANHPDEDSQKVASDKAEETIVESEELTYDDLTMPELKSIAKDRVIEVKGLKIGGLIEALEAYDEAEVSEAAQEVIA